MKRGQKKMLHAFLKTHAGDKERNLISDDFTKHLNRFLSLCVYLFIFVLLFQKQLFVFFFFIMSSEQCMYPLICQMSFIM